MRMRLYSHELPVKVVNLWYLLERLLCTNFSVKKMRDGAYKC